MKISVDGGALNPKNNQRFGTAIFSENLIRSLQLYDNQNIYQVYTFKNLAPKIFWMKGRVSIEELKEKKDIFLALNQALPLYASGKIISFCHGLSYYFYSKFYSKNDVNRLNNQLKEMFKRSDKIIVSSKKVKNELVSINRSVDRRIIVLPFGIPFDMENKKIKYQKEKYFMFVANNQKIKNADFIINCFNKSKLFDKNYKLFLIGDWKESENKDQGIISIGNISRKKLKTLYLGATALLTSSHYESFNFPVLESLSLGCPVIGLKSAVIPELKPFVNLSHNLKEFVEGMRKVNIKPNASSIRKLHTKFNWKKYVNNLVKLY
jgi:glycosyltransferase involved in cell wall biosynthesis